MSHYNDEQDDFAEFEQRESLSPTLQKIANFLEMNNIFISEFWQSNRNYASTQDLQKFCELCGLKLGIHDQINLKNELFSKREVISIYEFCDCIPHWKNKGSEMISSFLKERSEALVQNLNNKHKNQRIKSTSNSTSNLLSRPMTGMPSESQKRRLYSASKQSLKTYKTNNSQKYLEQNRMKMLKKEQQLAQTIEKTKNEHQYSMLMKMNQLNEYNHKNMLPTTYRAYKNAEGIIKVRVFELQNLKKELTIQQFESQFKIFKKSTKQNKQWERPVAPKPSPKDLLSRTTQENLSKKEKKQERQQELRNLLADTTSLTKLLQDQIKIFKLKGICGCEPL